jgi:integrative and conjugative element protein (TIGR02256 family)
MRIAVMALFPWWRTPVPPEEETIIFAEAVLEFIESQVRAAPEHLETGGLLMGHIGPGETRVVLAASPPGPRAVHHPTMFERDLKFSQYMLNEMYTRHQLEYVGEWHKHPRHFTAPSGGDLDGCRAILTDPAYRIAGLMLFPIFTLSQDGQVHAHYYCMDRSLTYRGFNPVIQKRDHQMESARAAEQRYLEKASPPGLKTQKR